MTQDHGKFVISLDFELMWGLHDKYTIKTHGKSVLGVHAVIRQLLDIFGKYNIRATFAVVGFIFFENKAELLKHLPEHKPEYTDRSLSPYNYIGRMCADSALDPDPYHFAPDLVSRIKKKQEHEIGTHTFSHYFCLEGGQTIDSFNDDLKSAVKTAQDRGIYLSALVFPKNQFNSEYLQVCKDNGIICYRGNQFSWIYTAKNENDESLFRRALRLADAYINLSGHNCYSDDNLKGKFPINIPASRYLRPYTKMLKHIDRLRLKRIKEDMQYAAKNNMTYHLWWHPYNFGINQKENFDFLARILEHYKFLNERYRFKSYTMSALAAELLKNNGQIRNQVCQKQRRR